jgi:hypothetical protein
MMCGTAVGAAVTPPRGTATEEPRCWAATGVAASAATIIKQAGNRGFFIGHLHWNNGFEPAHLQARSTSVQLAVI